MAYASASDVTVRWAKDADAETVALIETRLGDAERMIRRRITDLDTQAEDADYLADLIQIEADAVLRLVRNPDGYLSETDGDYTYMLQQGSTPGRLEVLAEEWEILGYTPPSKMSILIPNPVMPT